MKQRPSRTTREIRRLADLIGQGKMRQSDAVSAHILPSSATLVGACITALSVVKFAHVGTAGVFFDRLLGIATCLFLVSAIASFAAIRRPAAGIRLENAAETVFLIALGLVTIAAVGMAFEMG